MSEVIICMANGTEEIEALTVVDLLRRAQVSVAMYSVHGEDYVVGSHDIKIAMDNSYDEIDWERARMLVLPGGMPGTNHFLASKELAERIRSFHEQGKYIAAICAAPSVLGQCGILQGRRATCYPCFSEKLIGAKYEESSVVCDGNIITSRGLGTAIEFSAALIEVFCGKEVAQDILEKII